MNKPSLLLFLIPAAIGAQEQLDLHSLSGYLARVKAAIPKRGTEAFVGGGEKGYRFGG